MVDPVSDLKDKARILHHQVRLGDPRSLARLRSLSELAALDDAALRETVKRRHCLSVIARDIGLAGWSHASAVLSGRETREFGTLLYTRHSYWNIWSASYEEASAIRAEHGGYLLPYQRQFMIVDDDYVTALGVPPDDDWDRIGRDWVRPADLGARERLCQRVVLARVAAIEA